MRGERSKSSAKARGSAQIRAAARKLTKAQRLKLRRRPFDHLSSAEAYMCDAWFYGVFTSAEWDALYSRLRTLEGQTDNHRRGKP